MAISYRRSLIVLAFASAAVCGIVTGCSNMGQNPITSAAAASTAPAPTTTKPSNAYLANLGDAQLWQQTCSHCHNLRDPSSYSAAQWDVVLYDMRIRAQLTGEEQRRILQFLKSTR